MNVEHKKLEEFASIRTGFPFRNRVEHVEEDGVPLVQLGDVRADKIEIKNVQARVKVPLDPSDHFLQHGDIVFSGRGARNEAAVFVGDAKTAIASPHLFVIRLKQFLTYAAQSVEPGYVSWFLNHPQTQEKIRAMRMGSAVPFVPMSAFRSLEIPLPPLETQRRMAEIHRLSLREDELVKKVQKLRRKFIDAALFEAVTDDLTKEMKVFI